MDMNEIVRSIRPLDEESMNKARSRQDNLTKPKGSLGRLEDISVQLAGIYGTAVPRIEKKSIFTMAADHGVTEEGVSAYPSNVTAQMVLNFARGGAAINVLGRHAGVSIYAVDMGVRGENAWPGSIISCRIRPGTGNFSRECAMTVEEATEAVMRGIELSHEKIDDGSNLIGIGDMGIGNTTSAAAICSLYSGRPAADVTGRGTGLDDSGLHKKIEVIDAAIRGYEGDAKNPLDVLSKFGGLEIAGMTGVILGAASRRVPVILDGFISGASALIASSISPRTREYMIASHLSVENGHGVMLELLGLEPLLDLRLRLGEGTGAALAMMIVEASCKILNEMATFELAGVARKIE